MSNKREKNLLTISITSISACLFSVRPVKALHNLLMGALKLTAEQIEECYHTHMEDDSREHIVQPKLVYLSQPTELGTLYSLAELEAISQACRRISFPLSDIIANTLCPPASIAPVSCTLICAVCAAITP